MLKLICVTAIAAPALAQMPTITVTKDDTLITQSCLIEIPAGTVIEDANGNGVLQIGADDVVVRFASGSILAGAPKGTAGDQLKGVGIRLEGRKGVTLSGVHVEGFKVGIHATKTDNLMVEGSTLRENFRQHLKSTPEAEDSADWLYPHNNDNREWITNYGAGICIEQSSNVIVTNVKVQAGQNGIILDRVGESRVYSNDCRYLSGWGVAMWRSSDNLIARNRLDFCVRGYSHGVYNRGQDSAGILIFEQCSRNLIAENSATHCGDGLFGFAGREALGETGTNFDVKRAGCNDNIIIDNDFSDCVAHGLELTFSFGNKIIRNKFAGDAICGIWAGYSQDTLIAQNSFDKCGDMAYGLERGGINIEHGAGNVIIDNAFNENACGVHLWWDDDKELLGRPWAKANYKGVTGNVICKNKFEQDKVAFQLRDAAFGNVKDNSFFDNTITRCDVEREVPRGAEPITEGTVPTYELPARTLPEGRRAVNIPNARGLKGRQSILVTEWGPWDSETPLLWRAMARPASHLYEFRLFPGDAAVSLDGAGVEGRLAPPAKTSKYPTYIVSAREEGVFPYSLRVKAGSFEKITRGVISNLGWSVKAFQWSDSTDPRSAIAQWRALAEQAPHAKTGSLNFNFAMNGPSDLLLSEAIKLAALKPDHFGVIATTTVPLPKGKWRVDALSDDGIRVLVDGKPVLENWTWHGPARDSAEFTVDSDQTTIIVEYFEIDGFSVLDVDLSKIQ